MAVPPKSVLALDVGSKRIGVAIASLASRLPQPHTTLSWNDDFFSALDQIIMTEAVGSLVVGLPRGIEGQHTAQTRAVEAFVEDLRAHVGSLPIYTQDEALTSRQAKAELTAKGKPYRRGDIDALAATYILTDFLVGQRELTA